MNPAMTKVALIIGSGLLREALSRALRSYPQIEVVAIGASSSEATEIAGRGEADALLFDASIPDCDWLGLASFMGRLKGGPGLLLLSLAESHGLALRMLRCGVKGVLLRHTGLDEICEALEHAAKGEVYMTREMERFCSRQLLHPDLASRGQQLSDREMQIACKLAQGRSNKEIAVELKISVKTVDTHRANLLRKLSLRNNSDLTRFAIQSGWVACEVAVGR
jgi:DNA-binding NarL/FixJ family response regulator